MQKIIFLLLIFICPVKNVHSQSAVYWDYGKDAIGIAWGLPSQKEAEDSAYLQCVQNGGFSPRLIASTKDKGFGVVAIGKDGGGNAVIAAAIGEDSADFANQQARYDCEQKGATKESIKIKASWEDK